MRINQRQLGDVVVLDVAGPIAGHNAAEAVRSAVDGHSRPGSSVVVNLARVPAVDLAGLSALVDSYSDMRRAGGVLRLAGITNRIHDLLVITRLLTVFEVFDSVEDAVGGPTPAYSESALSTASLGIIQRFLRRA
jgi:anti-sigma B factor antagonist